MKPLGTAPRPVSIVHRPADGPTRLADAGILERRSDIHRSSPGVNRTAVIE